MKAPGAVVGIVVAAVAAVGVAGCSSGVAAQPSGSGSGTAADYAPAEQAVDPYDMYLQTNPDPSLVLSREDAQARALLGCSSTWAPGTLDHALHVAYADLCAEAQDEQSRADLTPKAIPSVAPTARTASPAPRKADPASSIDATCGNALPRFSTFTDVLDRGPATDAVLCTYSFAPEGFVKAAPSNATKVYSHLVAAAPTPNPDRACTADLPAPRAIVLTYDDGNRLALGVSLPASCSSFDDRNSHRDMSAQAVAYFRDLASSP